ncbi:hypothetical protein ABZ128_30965 [Streptomyces sp. NPDC006326]|uniref:DUF7144 family membrane protein n=1 Tax=Streptomyces sp. NPDC006326 TaxID=3156752 RepID=UPI0033B37D82
MSGTPSTAPRTTPSSSSGSNGRNAWAAGGTMFAGVLMIVNGIFGIFEGIAGIAHNHVYARVDHYVFKFNLTTWGWIHLIVGLLVAIAGAAILKGSTAGRIVGIALAALSVIAHFMWLPYQPVWSLIAIAIGVFVIWALCTDHPARTGTGYGPGRM